MDHKFASRNDLITSQLLRPIPVKNIDGTPNAGGQITHSIVTELHIQKQPPHAEQVRFLISDLGKEDIILGTDWLRQHNPDIDWSTDNINFSRCPASCTPERMAFAELEDDNPDTPPEWELNGINIFKMTLSTEIAQRTQRTGGLDLVPKQYHDYKKVFDEEASKRLPKHKAWDHAIDLKEGITPYAGKAYPIDNKQRAALETFIQENVDKGYIRPSTSPWAAPFFFVGKKDGKLRPCQDYRELNERTIPNKYPLPLIPELIDQLKDARIFTKLDLRWGYNNIRIKDGDEHKAAFVAGGRLWEPTVMFFGMQNSPATFQAMMNDRFADLIRNGHVVIYMDDILIFTKDMETHRHVVKQVLQRLQDEDLFLKPEKCFFERDSIEYLGMIIAHNQVRMDPAKLSAIADWPHPKTVKDVQSFLGFGNFYRRFIKDYAHITKPLTELTQKDYPWEWTPPREAAFQELKQRFTTTPVLMLPDFDAPFRLETDASDYDYGAILTQQGPDSHWHPVAYMSKQMTPPERNYNIYDKELLAIVRALDAWRHYLEGSPHPIEIWSDHKNLEYFSKAKQLNRRQARWSLFLSRFNFTITHRAGTLNKADRLTRRSDHEEGVKFDNSDSTVLKPEVFRINATGRHTTPPRANHLKQQIIDACHNDGLTKEVFQRFKNLGPRKLAQGIQEWNFEDGILLFRGKIYIPDNLDLRRQITRAHHDVSAAGHPGRWKTYELMQRDYWWPGMSNFTKAYVDGCATCQSNKNITHPTKAPLIPTQTPDGPWKHVTTDFVTDLPELQGFDSINVVVDKFSKAIVITPCKKTITASETAQLFLDNVWKRFGLPDKIISDRGPQFASKVSQEVWKALGITSAMSTAYHPQTDGETERVNQEIEQFLRTTISQDPGNWLRLLPFAEFSHNNKVHSTTRRSPFEILMGYTPRFTITPINPSAPEAQKRLDQIRKIREEVSSSQEIADKAMKLAHDKYGTEFPTFKPGDQVWLDGKNLRLQHPKVKLAPKRFGPFKIKDALGPVTYRLKLPSKWKIHPVFHLSLLMPYKETPQHGPNFLKPPPEEIEGTPEYEVESIVQSRVHRGHLQYLVKWKGYPEADNTWEPTGHLKHAQEAINSFHKLRPSAPRPIRSLGIDLFELRKHMTTPLTHI
jgi:transposase InsO family protein